LKWLEFKRGRLGERVHRGFAGRIDREERERLERHARRDVDDDPFLPLPHLRQNRLRHRDRSERVRLKNIAGDLHRRSLNRIEPTDAGIVYQHIHRTCGINRGADAYGARDIERNDLEVVRGRQKVLARRSYGGDHLPALREKEPGNFQAEPRRASCNENGLHICLLSILRATDVDGDIATEYNASSLFHYQEYR
jgi:hypothetical protein